MTFRKLLMLGGIGGLVYAHRKRGGQMTLDSFKQSGRDLVDGLKARAMDLKSQAEQKLSDANIGGAQSFGSSDVSNVGSDVGYGSSGYDYNRNR